MKLLKNCLILATFFLINAQSLLAQNAQDKIVCKWKTEDNTVVEIYKTPSNNLAVKQLSAGKEADKKYNSKVIGKDILGKNNEFTGIVIDPSNNKEYKATWTLSADATKLTLSVKWGFMSFKETWFKMN
jgi:uncharacterized protein (DUF2147 family)